MKEKYTYLIIKPKKGAFYMQDYICIRKTNRYPDNVNTYCFSKKGQTFIKIDDFYSIKSIATLTTSYKTLTSKDIAQIADAIFVAISTYNWSCNKYYLHFSDEDETKLKSDLIKIIEEPWTYWVENRDFIENYF